MAGAIELTGGTVVQAEKNTRALRVTLAPKDGGKLGSYPLAGVTGVLPAALTANSEIFQFRHAAGAGRVVVIRSVKISAAVSTIFFAAGVPVQIDMKVARNWTVDGSGGTAIVFSTANTNKKRTRMPLSGLSDTGVRIASTAALGAGTKTLDTNAVGFLVAPGPITGSLDPTIIRPGTVLLERAADSEYPLVLEHNEGFVIRSVAVPATGTWTAAVQVEWAELDKF